MENPRYIQLNLPPAKDDEDYPRRIRDSFEAAVVGCREWVGRRPSGGCTRPQCYWTVKQKSLITSVAEPIIKVRPIVTHCQHPLRLALRKVARALAVLVCDARQMVLEKRPTHLPMWQLHSGSAEWLERIAATKGWWGCDEYDVADCFLNTPRGAVLAAVEFWMFTTRQRLRRQPCFAIAKDGKAGDHRGQPSSAHYWSITAKQLLEACTWDLECNDAFEVQTIDSKNIVVGQHRGLPIGGHLSAAYVELVALQRELQCPWPSSLEGLPTARYRDNFFVVLREEWSDAQRQTTAKEMSDLLLMPVGFERGGRVARCLELRIDWSAKPDAVKATLAYRTDADRQGESGDVRTWPEWRDPRAPALLHGLLSGLAAKVVRYAAPGVEGLPASVRGAVQFLRRRNYPLKRWMRPFGLQLLRHGVQLSCLPRCLRTALGSPAPEQRRTD